MVAVCAYLREVVFDGGCMGQAFLHVHHSRLHACRRVLQLVRWYFKASQLQRIISKLREAFVKGYIVQKDQ